MSAIIIFNNPGDMYKWARSLPYISPMEMTFAPQCLVDPEFSREPGKLIGLAGETAHAYLSAVKRRNEEEDAEK